jgi:hypothetical protein
MRFIIRAIIQTEAGNRAVKDCHFIKPYKPYVGISMYLNELNGDRTSIFISEMMLSAYTAPVIAEPFLQMDAKS